MVVTVRPEVRMVPPPTWKERTDFLCHKITALEIQSIVASTSTLTGSRLSKVKHRRTIDYLNATKLSVPRAESRQNVLWRLMLQQAPEAWSLRLLDPKAREQTSSPGRILMYYQKQGPYGSQE